MDRPQVVKIFCACGSPVAPCDLENLKGMTQVYRGLLISLLNCHLIEYQHEGCSLLRTRRRSR